MQLESAILLNRQPDGTTHLQEVKEGEEFVLIEPFIMFRSITTDSRILFVRLEVIPEMTSLDKSKIDLDVWYREIPMHLEDMIFYKYSKWCIDFLSEMEGSTQMIVGGLSLTVKYELRTWDELDKL